MEIGNLVVPFLSMQTAQIRPGHEGAIAAHLDLGLEGVGEVWLSLFRRNGGAMVHEEDRDRARSLRDVLLEILCHDQPFDDVVAVTGHWTKYGCVYQIPYRSLLPQRVDNLLAAGRCISVDHRAHHATKEIPACFATGEAAGTAAALALRADLTPREVDISTLQRALLKAGAWLPDGSGDTESAGQA